MADEQVADLEGIAVDAKRHRFAVERAHFWARNQIVWAGPEEVPEKLARLVSSLSGALERAGFRAEEREFAPHVTLIRKALKPVPLPPLPAVRWPVDEFLLVRSRLSAAGARYEVMRRFALP